MDPTPSPLDRYLRHRRFYEVGFWVLFWLLQAVGNSLTSIMEVRRAVGKFADWEPVVWEFSSCMVLLAMVPLVLRIEQRFPFRFARWRRSLLAHAVATVPFSLLHVGAMVLLRKLAYAATGCHYDFGNTGRQLVYEYLKDCRTYAYILAFPYVYRFFLLQLQGEASLLTAPEDAPAVEPVERPERFLVRKMGKEFLVAAADIEWLEASGNYVNLYVRGHHYPLRSTMAALEPRLDPRRFQRVHRSYMVNLDHLAEIEPLDTGDARLKLRDGTLVPCSRRYREALRIRAA
ncbi:MAG: LytTR family DNA-binding domain-containing protein [Nevskiales bacterium]